MDFGTAVAALKKGSRIARAGWNGKGMYVYLFKLDGYDPCLALFTAQGTFQPGWNASTPDVLAEDWQEFPA